MTNPTEQTLTERLRIRAAIRRGITTRKSVQNGEPDRIADLLEEAANEIERLNKLDDILNCHIDCLHDEVVGLQQDVDYLKGELQDIEMRKLERVC